MSSSILIKILNVVKTNIRHKKRGPVNDTSTENSLQELEMSRQIIDTTAITAHKKIA